MNTECTTEFMTNNMSILTSTTFRQVFFKTKGLNKLVLYYKMKILIKKLKTCDKMNICPKCVSRGKKQHWISTEFFFRTAETVFCILPIAYLANYALDIFRQILSYRSDKHIVFVGIKIVVVFKAYYQ